MRANIAVVPGDGIGNEVTAEAVTVLGVVAKRFGHKFEFENALIGGAAIDATGVPMPAETMSLVKKSDAVLLGAVGGPKWDDPRSTVRPEQALFALRKGLGLFANLRPVKLFPMLKSASTIKEDVIEGVDLVVVRELTGGLYFGKPSKRYEVNGSRRAIDTLPYSEEEISRVQHVAFRLARERRKKVTSVDKQNVLATSRLWREIAGEVAAQYPDVEHEDMLVDACAMHLIRRPSTFDVIVTENMFGDILTDESSMLAGSMGMLPSASIGYDNGDPKALVKGKKNSIRMGLYEPIHGSAPKYAGQNVANPVATILSAALMLRYSFGLESEARAIEDAVSAVLMGGYRCNDIMEPGKTLVGTREMGELIANKVRG
ncbi:MAG: 3-isopropylmalate dehydrogenase [Dehalococcoidales bacterium]|nr:3-isopropylmalate dehydrogenase [Dehalococcoidales bacterium]